MSKALAKSRNHPKGEECCDMSFEGLSPELMLCVRIRRERLWCSRPASKRSRQVFRRLLDQTAWDPNLGSRRVLRPILPRTEVSERQPPFRQDARTQIDRPSRDVRTHRAKENTCDNHFARCLQKKNWCRLHALNGLSSSSSFNTHPIKFDQVSGRPTGAGPAGKRV